MSAFADSGNDNHLNAYLVNAWYQNSTSIMVSKNPHVDIKIVARVKYCYLVGMSR